MLNPNYFFHFTVPTKAKQIIQNKTKQNKTKQNKKETPNPPL